MPFFYVFHSNIYFLLVYFHIMFMDGLHMKIEQFKTTNDFELGASGNERISEYKIFNSLNGNGLVVYIPGFGGDLGEYTSSFCKSITSKYKNYASMCVEYFCMRSRPSVGAIVEFEDDDRRILNIEDKKLSTEEVLSKLAHDFSSDNILNVNASLVPPNNEYQNFGVMAALDILNAVNDAVSKFKLDKNNIILIGSSYGGYLANLVTKISPGYIKAVFDNSSWAKPNLCYMVGRDLNRCEFSFMASSNVQLMLFVKSPWSLNPESKNYIGGDRMDIRSFSDDDIHTMHSYGGENTLYYFVHPIIDRIASTKDKVEMAKAMMNKGLLVKMELFTKKDIDGDFIKNIDHGMGLSMVKFFDKGMEILAEGKDSFVSIENEVVTYKYKNGCYKFELSKRPILASYCYN